MTSAERTIALSALARQTVVELNKLTPLRPLAWHFAEPTEDTFSVYLRNVDGARICLTFDGYNEPTRLSISGYLHIGKNGSYVEVYEHGENGSGWNKAVSPSISVAIARGPQAIAKDIAKRFLPEYLRIFALAQDKVRANEDYDAKITANLQRLANVAKVTVREEGQKSFTFRTGESQYHAVAVSSNDADLNLDSLTFEQAEHIIRYLRGKY